MRRYKFILLMLVVSLAWGCERVDFESNEYGGDISYNSVEVLENGQIRVTASLERLGMTSVETRASSTEDNIYNGWCLVFGETDSRSTNYVSEGYGDQSPLIQIVPITANANGTFFMTFEPFEDKAFMRIVVNMTDRENETLASIVSWQDLAASNSDLDETKTPSYEDVLTYRDENNLATFGQFRHQSVGLDGIYDIDYKTTAALKEYSQGITDYSGETVYYSVFYETPGSSNTGTNYITKESETYNNISPNPSTQLNTTTGFPMASYGFVMDNLSETTLADAFGTTIYMIRVCSKVVVDVSETYDASGSRFDMQAVYLIDAPQEARIRSTVLSTVTEDEYGDPSVTSEFSLPVDLGGLITYEAMPVSSGTTVSNPIYFYPNSGGNYTYTGSVDQSINPQYIIIKGQAAGYDTPGYYKVAIKAQYPLDASGALSELTYDILRNTFFTVKITNVDKPGYKTFEDAADVNSPANNISYSIEIEADNNHYEILVSKGTYHVELATSRVYAKGYGTDGLSGDNVYVDFTIYPTEGNYTPTVYVQSSDHDGNASDQDVEILYCEVTQGGVTTKVELSDNKTDDGLSDKLVKIESSDEETEVRVYFKATDSGRIRLRIGDILKFIPVVYEATAIKIEGESPLTITDNYGTTWNNFAYNSDSDIEITVQTDGGVTDASLSKRILQHDGSTINNTDNYKNLELHTRVYTSDNSGIAQLYLRQASDFNLFDNITNAEAADSLAIVYKSTGLIYQITYDDQTTTYSGDGIEGDINSYTINGDVDIVKTGEITEFFNFDESTTSESFTFSSNNIGTNESKEYAAHIDESYKITLTNIAGETKTYTIDLDQYAAPYCPDDTDGDGYVEGGTADRYIGIYSSNRGKDLNTITVYNCYYVAGDYPYGDWYWTDTDGNVIAYADLNDTSSSTFMTNYKYATNVTNSINVQANNDNEPDYVTFTGNVNDIFSGAKYTGTAYCVLRLTNGAGEEFNLTIRYYRDDNLNP